MIYFCRNEEIYCERHYADTIYPRCAACDEVIQFDLKASNTFLLIIAY
jgi:prickle